jgi:hypothetical protein
MNPYGKTFRLVLEAMVSGYAAFGSQMWLKKGPAES